MPADPIRRTIVLGPAAHELRRHVGPTAWVVLEEMLQRSTGNDHVVAQVSIRSLASSLGLAKDTVNRAVGRLRDLGVIEAAQARARSGVFDAGSYRLVVPAVCLSPAGPTQPSAFSPAARPSCAAPPSAPRASSAARPSPSARRSSGQLSLLLEV